MSKLSKKQSIGMLKVTVPPKFDPAECPFREFKDTELTQELWGVNAGLRLSPAPTNPPTKGDGKGTQKASSFSGNVWHDEQIQPLPRSIRHYLDGWVSAESLAAERWECMVVVADETKSERMAVIDYQLTFTQVLLRSRFCRDVLSACYNLERVENLTVEHQWEYFNCVLGPEGWRPKYHIYSPGMKPGGGVQHKTMLSKNGCYLVRLYYLGAWRCVWVSDLVPVDASGSPLLPFAPLTNPAVRGKGNSVMTTSPYVFLWPLLLCKAILKLAAPEMVINETFLDEEVIEDEDMPEFNILHCLSGGLSMSFNTAGLSYDDTWHLIWREAKVFSWDNDDDQASGTVKSKAVKKPNPKDKDVGKVTRDSIMTIEIIETKENAPFTVPGITPAHAMDLYLSLIRDVPLKKPLPEPEVPPWKHIRWVDWAKSKGLYEAYDCPRTKYLRVTGLMKMSYAPHLLDVVSNESITQVLKDEDKKPVDNKKKQPKEIEAHPSAVLHAREELREWVLYEALQPFINVVNVTYCPSTYEYNSGASKPPIRRIHIPGIDVAVTATAPLYFQIDGPEEITLRISLSVLHPRVLSNCGNPQDYYIEKAYLFVETLEWFIDVDLPVAKAFCSTRGYDSVDVNFLPGRHYCRLWVHSQTHWHVSLLSEARIILGTRDVILSAAIQECDWSTRFLSTLGNAFSNWIRGGTASFLAYVDRDKEFYSSYQPDLTWDPEEIGYSQTFVHWMFRKALQSYLHKRLSYNEYYTVCSLLRRPFNDPEFGFPPKPKPPRDLQEVLEREPCVCVIPEPEVVEEEEQDEEQQKYEGEKAEVSLLSPEMIEKLLMEPEQLKSHVCDLATDELQCGKLKEERLKYIKKHEAAIMIQKNWRGYYVRKVLNTHLNLTNESLKLISECIFGNFEALSALMNEFFFLFPKTRHAYSLSSGLNGMRSLQQNIGYTTVTPTCKFIPYFQGVFNCHWPVNIHVDVNSAIEHSSIAIYDNDTGEQLRQAHNAHITLHVEPNIHGYSVLAHGALITPLEIVSDIEVFWNFSILASSSNAFHVCDEKDDNTCSTLPLPHAAKIHVDEMYIPNRKNILGAIEIHVNNVEVLCFRAETTVHTLPIEATLRTTDIAGNVEVIAKCVGQGEIFWPYLYLKPHAIKSEEYSSGNLTISASTIPSLRNLAKGGKSSKGSKVQSRSLTRLQTHHAGPRPLEPKIYTIEVTAPEGWALPYFQWKRVDEVRNAPLPSISPPPPVEKESVKESAKGAKAATVPKASSAKSEKKKDEQKSSDLDKPVSFVVPKPKAGDAYTVLECASSQSGGVFTKRDDTRDILFATAVRNWNIKDPLRMYRGAEIRQQFREEFLVPDTVKSDSVSFSAEGEFEWEGEAMKRKPKEQVTTPVSEDNLSEVESVNESLYYTMPEIIKDKFVPLYFLAECTKEMTEEKGVILTNEMKEAAKAERVARFESELRRMRELQLYNQTTVLELQRIRIQRFHSLDVDDVWGEALLAAFEECDAAVQLEIIKQVSAAANKKKMEQLAKEAEKRQDKQKPKGKT